MAIVRLDDISFGDDEVDEAFGKWRAAIEEAHNWKITGHCTFHATAGGYALHVKGSAAPLSAVVATGGITAAAGNNLGQGNATIRYRTGAALTDGPTVLVYSNFTVAIPATTRIEIAPDGDAYKLLGADCVT